MKLQIAMLGAICMAGWLHGCGGDAGGDSGPPVTVVYVLTPYDETNAYVAMMRQVTQRGVVPSNIECGLLNNWKAPIRDWFIWVEGYDPRLAYLTFDAADFAAVQDMPWHAIVDKKWTNTYDDPFDCGPLPALD